MGSAAARLVDRRASEHHDVLDEVLDRLMKEFNLAKWRDVNVTVLRGHFFTVLRRVTSGFSDLEYVDKTVEMDFSENINCEPDIRNTHLIYSVSPPYVSDQLKLLRKSDTGIGKRLVRELAPEVKNARKGPSGCDWRNGLYTTGISATLDLPNFSEAYKLIASHIIWR